MFSARFRTCEVSGGLSLEELRGKDDGIDVGSSRGMSRRLGEYGFWYNLRKCRLGRRINVVCLASSRALVYFDSLSRLSVLTKLLRGSSNRLEEDVLT